MKQFCLLSFFLVVLIFQTDAQSPLNVKNDLYKKSTPSAFSALENHFHQYVDEGKLPGVVSLVAHKGKVVYKDAYGMRRLDREQAIQTNTIFRLASLTKPITSVAVMMLVEQGKVQLETPVYQYIPAFKKVKVYGKDGKLEKLHRPITVKDLLMHTSGLSTGYFDRTAVGDKYKEVFKESPKTLEELVERLPLLPLKHQPGEGWTYSYSTDVLARIVEVVSGISFSEFLEKNIFQPLKMEDTGFSVPAEKVERFAALYHTSKEGGLMMTDAPEDSPYSKNEIFGRGNSGLVSTVEDYYRFAEMLLQKGSLEGVQILKPETVELMTQNHLLEKYVPLTLEDIVTFPGHAFGLGFGVLNEKCPYGKAGTFLWMGATNTYFFVDPVSEVVGVFMTQFTDIMKYPLMPEFHELVYRGLSAGVEKDVNK